MATVREYLKSIQKPWFIKKKFLKIFLIVVGILFLAGAFLSFMLYQEAEARGHVNLKKVTEPLALPVIALMLYAIVALMWLAIKLKEFQRTMIRNIPSVFSAPQFVLNSGEQELFKASLTARSSAGSLAKIGVFRITNQRILHSQSISTKRVGVLLGMDEPNVTLSLPFTEIRQCGFGLDEKHAKAFSVITVSGDIHSFTGVTTPMVDEVITKLGWRRTRIDEQIYWIK